MVQIYVISVLALTPRQHDLRSGTPPGPSPPDCNGWRLGTTGEENKKMGSPGSGSLAGRPRGYPPVSKLAARTSRPAQNRARSHGEAWRLGNIHPWAHVQAMKGEGSEAN